MIHLDHQTSTECEEVDSVEVKREDLIFPIFLVVEVEDNNKMSSSI